MKYVAYGPSGKHVTYAFKGKNVKVTTFDHKLKKLEIDKIAIVFGIRKFSDKKSIWKENVCKLYAHTIICELGIFRPYYFSVTLDGFLGKSPNLPKNMSPERFLNMNIEHWQGDEPKNNSGYILVCGQIPDDTQVQHIDYINWLNSTIEYLKEKYEVVYRPHPKLQEYFELRKPHVFSQMMIHSDILDTNESLSDSFAGASCVVAFNSTCLVDAVLYGLPIICFDNTSLVYDLATHTFDRIKFPDYAIRLQTFANISYTQWNMKELAKGLHLKFINTLIKY
jgi:hypothetical protein